MGYTHLKKTVNHGEMVELSTGLGFILFYLYYSFFILGFLTH